MGTIANPAWLQANPWANPALNPTGSQIAVPSGSTQNPFMNTNPTSASNPSNTNPYSATTLLSSTPTAAAVPSASTGSSTTSTSGTVQPSGNNTVPVSSSGQTLGFPTTTQGQQNLYRNLEKTYGSGLASTIMQFLAGGAGYNQQSINNLIASLQPQFNAANENLATQFSAGGSRFSSGAELGQATLSSEEGLDVGSLETQMYEQAVSDYMNVLMGVSGGTASRILQKNAQNSSGASGILSDISGASGAASSITSAIDPSADTSLLDAIAALG